MCPKNVTTLSRCNSDIHESILVIFEITDTEEVGNQKAPVLYFPPHVTSASALPGEMKKDK